MASAVDFPHQVTSLCCNFRYLNELVVGSGQYLFWFRILKTSFEFSLNCISYLRIRAPIRSLTWHWGLGSKLAVKEAILTVGDCEEGVSLFVINDKENSLRMRGYDMGLK